MKQYFEQLNNYFNKIYVITIERAEKRREKISQNFNGLNYEFFYGTDKNTLDAEKMSNLNLYDEEKAKKMDRYCKPMTLGHIACSLSHRKVYEKMVQDGIRKAMIFEDDAIPAFENLSQIPFVLEELPADWEFLYWGYDKNDQRGLQGFLKQKYYYLGSLLGLIKWSPRMIKNLYARPFSPHLKKAGRHDLLHAYSLTLSAAEKLIKLQTPVIFNADPAIAHAITNDLIKAYISKKIIFYQEVQLTPDSYHSFIKE
jgi:glycosyl transferase family 25